MLNRMVHFGRSSRSFQKIDGHTNITNPITMLSSTLAKEHPQRPDIWQQWMQWDVGSPFGVLRHNTEWLGRLCVSVYVVSCCRVQTGPQLVYIIHNADHGLLEAIQCRAAQVLSIGTAEFRDLVRQAALATSVKEVPGEFPKKWIQRWVHRHNDVISYRKGCILEVKRAQCSTEDTVQAIPGPPAVKG